MYLPIDKDNLPHYFIRTILDKNLTRTVVEVILYQSKYGANAQHEDLQSIQTVQWNVYIGEIQGVG